MPRHSRFQSGGFVFHVLNRRAGRQRLFYSEGDYAAFLAVLNEAQQNFALGILSYALMPTHWHLLVWPENDGDLAEFMRWLTVTHTHRWHLAHHSTGTGPVYQGRYKSFPVQDDDHFYTVARYIERNPLRAGLVASAESWRWSSLWQRRQECVPVQLGRWPVPLPEDWPEYVNGVETEAELAAVRESLSTGIPFGDESWRLRTARALQVRAVARPRGRPRKPF